MLTINVKAVLWFQNYDMCCLNNFIVKKKYLLIKKIIKTIQ